MPVFTTVTFAPGATTATVDVITVEDSTNELAEMFTAVLQSPTGGAMLGASSTATVTIMDDDGEWSCKLVSNLFPLKLCYYWWVLILANLAGSAKHRI